MTSGFTDLSVSTETSGASARAISIGGGTTGRAKPVKVNLGATRFAVKHPPAKRAQAQIRNANGAATRGVRGNAAGMISMLTRRAATRYEKLFRGPPPK